MNALSSSPVIQCQQLSKEYLEGERPLQVLDQVSLTIAAGECVAIVGRSGSGKSTLLHMLGGLDTPSQGEVWLNGEPLAKASERQLAQWRNQYLGFVYQFHHLLPEFTALENVAMPLLLANHGRKQAKQRAAEVLDWVGMTERLQHKPAALSGGERQRTAIARALIQQPRCVLAAICFCRSRNRALSFSDVLSMHKWQETPSSYSGLSLSDGKIGCRQAWHSR